MKISCFTQEKWIFSLKSNIDQVCFLDLVLTSTPLKFLKNWVFPFFSWVLWKYLSFVGKLGTEFFKSRNWVFRFCSKNKPAFGKAQPTRSFWVKTQRQIFMLQEQNLEGWLDKKCYWEYWQKISDLSGILFFIKTLKMH